MARIYLSPLIVDIRNKQSDTVFSKWKGINYIRSRVIPANPKTAAQVAVRESLRGLVVLWQTAHPSMKLNWDEWAAGKDYSGFNKFIGKNVIDNRDGNLLDIYQEVGWPTLATFSIGPGAAPGDIAVTFTPTPVTANNDLELYFREVGQEAWTKKEILPAATTSPQNRVGFTPTTLYEGYGLLVNDTTPAGDEIGNDLSDTGLSQT